MKIQGPNAPFAKYIKTQNVFFPYLFIFISRTKKELFKVNHATSLPQSFIEVALVDISVHILQND